MDSEEDEILSQDLVPSCLVHNYRWRCRYQCILNQLRNDCNSRIRGEHCTKISRAICTCRRKYTSMGPVDIPQDPRWNDITEEQFVEAEKFFEGFMEHLDKFTEYWSLLKYQYQSMRQMDELQESSSARRFLMIFQQLRTTGSSSLLNRETTETRERERRSAEKIHLRSLKTEYVPLYCGQNGRNLRRYLKGKKKVKVKIEEQNGNVYASISCREQDKKVIKDRLTHEADMLAERRRIHEANQREYQERQQDMDADNDSETEGKSMDE